MPRTFVEISRQKLVENYESIRRLVGSSVEILAVVKADAYGHGAVEVARTLEGAGAGWFAVTSVSEGIELRQRGIRGRIVVLTGADRAELDALAEFDLDIVVHTIDQLRDLEAWAGIRRFRPAVHLKFDSGMGRLGFQESTEVARLLAACPNIRVEALATHFASAEDLSSGQTAQQIRRFEGLVSELAAGGIRPRFIHMANSAALAYWPETWGSMVRPGLALYGYLMPPCGAAAVAQPPLSLQPVLSWKAQILAVKEYPAGTPLGYGAAFRTGRPTRVGVVAAGYADGLDRRLSNGGIVLAAGRRVPIVGLISMDLSLIDLTSAPETSPGHYVTLLGRDGDEAVDAMEIAGRCQTIPYEVLCGIGKRVTSLYTI